MKKISIVLLALITTVSAYANCSQEKALLAAKKFAKENDIFKLEGYSGPSLYEHVSLYGNNFEVRIGKEKPEDRYELCDVAYYSGVWTILIDKNTCQLKPYSFRELYGFSQSFFDGCM